MKREEVISIINEERDYQDKLILDKNRPDVVKDLRMGDYIGAIQHNLTQGIGAWYSGSGNYNEAMHYIRKISALCVQLGEKYEMPRR